MSSSDSTPTAPEEDATTPDDLGAAAALRRDKIAAFLVEKWGATPPPCPYCRITAWSIDPHPVLLQRMGELPGFGVPIFLVFCQNCGHEVQLSVESTGLWEEVVGYPLAGAPTDDSDEAEPTEES